MAGAGKKTFTAGEVLTASDVNTYLMEQSVMYFGGTAARASAIPTPSTGMTTYIGVTGTATIPQLETYTGSAWQTPYGITQVARGTFTGATGIQIDNCFTSNYDFYRITLDVTTTVNQSIYGQLCLGGSRLSTATYLNAGRYWDSGSGGGATDSNSGATSWFVGYATTGGSFSGLDMLYPATTKATLLSGVSGQGSTAVQRWGQNSNTTAYDGIYFLVLSGTITGTVRVYGYRNS